MITADDRLDKPANDFVEHCSTRWQTGKSRLVCIDKIACARMFQRIEPRWKAKIARLRALIPEKGTALATATDVDVWERLTRELEALRGQTVLFPIYGPIRGGEVTRRPLAQSLASPPYLTFLSGGVGDSNHALLSRLKWFGGL